MRRTLTTAVVVMLVVLPLSVVVAAPSGEAQAEGAVAPVIKLEKPEDLATLKGLSYPGFACPIMVELDAGMLSMLPVLEPVLKQLLQGQSNIREKMGPEAWQILSELLASLKGVAVAVQTPRNGEINVPKVSSFYLQRALAAGWKQCVGINEGKGQSIALFQLPTRISAGGSSEPPQGIVLVIVTPQQVIAAGLLGQLDLGKLLPLIAMLR